ncbi:MAG: hypothetical protein F9K29_11820 [Hyphomicrobiaceae bacterium]|nr:MAG: hypothetical protein F9K29_11820 [Hyphomicrobiaceae bacterium]
MRRALLLFAALIACFAGPARSQQSGDFAAVAANNEGNLQVRWGRTEAEAKQRAAEACRSVSRTCSSDPAHTNQLDDVFAFMCCNKPHFSCGSPPHESRGMATREARQLMTSRGYSDCTVRAFFSARTGKRQ